MKHLVVKKYVKIWYLMTLNGMAQLFQTRLGAGLFVAGKVFRFVFFLILLVRVVGSTQVLAGYNLEQVVFFFLTFNLIDTTSQMFFRGVYLFRRLVVSGDFDLILTKPVNPLFRVIFSNTDLLDFSVLVPLVFGTVWYAVKFELVTSAANVVWYFLLVFNGILIALALHILVVALAVVTTEIDSTIMLYRDLTSMARVPVDLYRKPLRTLLTFAVPVGLMMTIPAKAFFGLLSGAAGLGALIFSGLLFLLSARAWRFSLRHYTSASS